jgi:hypothetical protein
MTRPVSLGSEAGWGGGAPRAAARGKASTGSSRCPGGTRFLGRQTSGTTGGPGTCGASGGRRPADRDTEADPGGGPAGAASRLSRSRVAPPSPRRVYAERLGGGGAVCVRRAGRASRQFTWAKRGRNASKRCHGERRGGTPASPSPRRAAKCRAGALSRARFVRDAVQAAHRNGSSHGVTVPDGPPEGSSSRQARCRCQPPPPGRHVARRHVGLAPATAAVAR